MLQSAALGPVFAPKGGGEGARNGTCRRVAFLWREIQDTLHVSCTIIEVRHVYTCSGMFLYPSIQAAMLGPKKGTQGAGEWNQ